jgi:hypothetical protein
MFHLQNLGDIRGRTWANTCCLLRQRGRTSIRQKNSLPKPVGCLMIQVGGVVRIGSASQGNRMNTKQIWRGISLCETCVHRRDVQTARSRFLLCELSASNHNFPKYPPQPIGRCSGYLQKDKPEDATDVNPIGT